MASPEALESLYEKARLIQDGKANRLWLPIAWHLSLRKHTLAMAMLANFLTDRDGLGRKSDPFSPFGRRRRAYRLGYGNSAQNLAMDHFNRNDLNGYRTWLRRAARSGDGNAAREFNCFETRLSQASARKI